MTTLSAFVTALQGMSVTGVERNYSAPPASVADLPAMWVQMPTIEEGQMTFGKGGGWPLLKAQIVVAVKPTAQGTQDENWTDVLSMCDALRTALINARPALGPVRWQPIRPGVVTVAGLDYWAAIAEVQTNG